MNPDQQPANTNGGQAPENNPSNPVNQPETAQNQTQPVADTSTAVPTENQGTTTNVDTAPVTPAAPVETSTPPAEPVATETPSPPVNTPTVTPITPQPIKKSKKGLIIAIVIFVIIAVIAAVIVFMLAGKNNDSKSISQNLIRTSQSSKNTTTPKNADTATSAQTSATKAIPGYVTLDKLCYSIQVPKDNDAGAENSCLFSARFGAQRLPGINFTYFTKPSEGLDVNVANLKESEAKLKHTLFSEENVKIGGIDSKKLIFKLTGYDSETQVVYFLIPTTKYKVSGVPITGFQVISSYYQRPEYKTVIDNIMSSIQWK